MDSNGFENRAMAYLKAFLERKNIFARRSSILVFLSTLTDVKDTVPILGNLYAAVAQECHQMLTRKLVARRP